MRRLRDSWFATLQSHVDFLSKTVLEIGCGDGRRSAEIASVCRKLVAIESNEERLLQAKKTHGENSMDFRHGSAENLAFPDDSFDIVIYTLSFHHVREEYMDKAISEAVRVTKSDGLIIFFEPAFEGTMFAAELAFDAGDGDEREKKALAYATMLRSPLLRETMEITNQSAFMFDSAEDFTEQMQPHKGTKEMMAIFFSQHGYLLRAQSRLHVFRPQK